MIDQAVILAAGKGTRIRAGEDDLPKPLHKVAGVTLLKRTLLTMARAGVRRAFVVVGYQADALRAAVAGDPAYARAGLTVELVHNADYERANGVSVLAVKEHVRGPFLLSMSDHVYDAEVARIAAAADTARADLTLCVDTRVAEIYDMDDATKVRTEDGRIVDIGKTIATFDCIDTGVFAVTPALFDALEAVRGEKGDCSLSDGVKRLAAAGRARVATIGEAFWQDVDTPGARERAERELFRNLRKAVDGPVSRYINRPLSLAITRRIIDTGITPNQMSVVAGLIGLAGALVTFFAGDHLALLAGALLGQAQSVLDGCDGEIARLKFQATRAGEWIDNVIDDSLNVLYCGALGVASARIFGWPELAWIGAAGAVGYAIYQGVLYHQLATVHGSGNPFLFRWWFQKDGADLRTTLARPGAKMKVASFLRAIARRDVFLLVFVGLIAVRLGWVAALWYATIGVAHLVMSVAHLVAGGTPRATEGARALARR
jgi:CDP-L-myo-inositol myo-inositolphosphotransferase